MSKLWNVHGAGQVEQYEELRKLCLKVVKKFPGLSASAFFEEVRIRLSPRPDEHDMRAAVLRLVSDGILKYTSDWTVIKG